ncbi:Protein MIS12 [Galemys pyrenaicus]|uniref:Protein MIS12 homolog n=1 Tax=Galemys pyrenaicus TaxID=202257 RepID=A0A8J6ADS5_GALPY|nr:Protein MIS12 [Galemys pyrenaicus]
MTGGICRYSSRRLWYAIFPTAACPPALPLPPVSSTRGGAKTRPAQSDDAAAQSEPRNTSQAPRTLANHEFFAEAGIRRNFAAPATHPFSGCHRWFEEGGGNSVWVRFRIPSRQLGIYIAFQDYLFEVMQAVEQVMLKKLEGLPGCEISPVQIRKCTEKFLCFMKGRFDNLFGKMEQLFLQLILRIPPNILLPEDKSQEMHPCSEEEFHLLQKEIEQLQEKYKTELCTKQALLAELEEQKIIQAKLRETLALFDELENIGRDHGTTGVPEFDPALCRSYRPASQEVWRRGSHAVQDTCPECLLAEQLFQLGAALGLAAAANYAGKTKSGSVRTSGDAARHPRRILLPCSALPQRLLRAQVAQLPRPSTVSAGFRAQLAPPGGQAASLAPAGPQAGR